MICWMIVEFDNRIYRKNIRLFCAILYLFAKQHPSSLKFALFSIFRTASISLEISKTTEKRSFSNCIKNQVLFAWNFKGIWCDSFSLDVIISCLLAWKVVRARKRALYQWLNIGWEMLTKCVYANSLNVGKKRLFWAFCCSVELQSPFLKLRLHRRKRMSPNQTINSPSRIIRLTKIVPFTILKLNQFSRRLRFSNFINFKLMRHSLMPNVRAEKTARLGKRKTLEKLWLLCVVNEMDRVQKENDNKHFVM